MIANIYSLFADSRGDLLPKHALRLYWPEDIAQQTQLKAEKRVIREYLRQSLRTELDILRDIRVRWLMQKFEKGQEPRRVQLFKRRDELAPVPEFVAAAMKESEDRVSWSRLPKASESADT